MSKGVKMFTCAHADSIKDNCLYNANKVNFPTFEEGSQLIATLLCIVFDTFSLLHYLQNGC